MFTCGKACAAKNSISLKAEVKQRQEVESEKTSDFLSVEQK
jgi:hypothetical protein